MQAKAFHISVQGASHIKKNKSVRMPPEASAMRELLSRLSVMDMAAATMFAARSARGSRRRFPSKTSKILLPVWTRMNSGGIQTS